VIAAGANLGVSPLRRVTHENCIGQQRSVLATFVVLSGRACPALKRRRKPGLTSSGFDAVAMAAPIDPGLHCRSTRPFRRCAAA
jgi:hypothetical protein